MLFIGEEDLHGACKVAERPLPMAGWPWQGARRPSLLEQQRPRGTRKKVGNALTEGRQEDGRVTKALGRPAMTQVRQGIIMPE